MRTFDSVNPYDGRVLQQYTGLESAELDQKLTASQVAFRRWRKTPLSERKAFLLRASAILREEVETFATMITQEMGKPITEARAEVLKCAWVCDYYAEQAAGFLADEVIVSGAAESYVRHDPMGAVLAIMPWNYPFWQVFRYAAPTLMAGNVCLLKHAPNVFGCAQQMEEVFTKAGFPDGVFQNLVVHHEETERIIAHDAVRAVTLTGSERAGSAVAALAGKYIKKSLLELGGSNAFMVWEDADIDQAVKLALTARMLNCGQSCIAAKRFILVGKTYEPFVEAFTAGMKTLRSGDPMLDTTQVGPLARKDLADQLQQQVLSSVQQGASLLLGGKQNACFHEPTVLGDVKPHMVAFEQETFGPLAVMVRAKDIPEAFALAEQSRYGLGMTVCTPDTGKAKSMASLVSDGAYFINELVKSDPRLPFGGTKQSGYGRELAKDGMMEFVNRKTVYVS